MPPAKIECSVESRPSKGSPAREAIPPRTVYERDTIVTVLIAATLGTAVAVGAVLIWTKPKTARTGIGSASVGGMVVPSSGVRDAESRPLGTDQEASAPRVVGTSGVAESLRQLKALHDEGILTDEEYEAKRKPLTDEMVRCERCGVSFLWTAEEQRQQAEDRTSQPDHCHGCHLLLPAKGRERGLVKWYQKT